jgi:hypothetical protein
MMKKALTFLLFILFAAACGFAQNPPGGYGASSSGGSAGGGGITSSIFNIASNCAGLTNCLQWVDNDSTDNCGSATTAWLAQVNSYAGPGESHVYIEGSGSGKAYKLASCNLAFTGPAGTGGTAGSVSVVSNATIDCAQSSGNCIQGGTTGCSTVSFYGTGCHDFTWRGGTITGCVNLTTACFEFEQGMFIGILDDVTFNNTGAGNATLGTCTNYSVQFDTFIGGIEMSRNKYFGTVLGQCFSKNNDVTGGANTITFTNNTISHTTGGACGGILHFDASTHSLLENNLLFGFGAIIVLNNPSTAAGGWVIGGNNVDTSGCTISTGKPASIQFGFTGVNNTINNVSVVNNNGYTSPLIAQYPGSSATMVGWTIMGNNTQHAIGSNYLIDGNSLTCASSGTEQPCYYGGNTGYNINGFGGAVYPGFVLLNGNYAHAFVTTQGANIGATNINGSSTLVTGLVQIFCQVIVTRAATTSSTMPSCTVGWTDLFTGVAETATITATSAANTLGTQSTGSIYASIGAASNVTYSTSGYASTGATTMQYGVFADVQKIY